MINWMVNGHFLYLELHSIRCYKQPVRVLIKAQIKESSTIHFFFSQKVYLTQNEPLNLIKHIQNIPKNLHNI